MSIEYYYNLTQGDVPEAFILAIQHKDWEAFLKLLPLQENINRTFSELDLTPLMYAVCEESLKMVKALVEVGADVNIVDLDPDDFALNYAAHGCRRYLTDSYQYNRNKAIFDYLAPLTVPPLQLIAQTTLTKKIF
jgi:hypothetical protein